MTDSTGNTESTDLTPPGINAAFSTPDSGQARASVFMVRGDWAVRHEAAAVAPPAEGGAMRDLWPGLPAAYRNGFDAACSTDTARVYLFKGATCVLYDFVQNATVPPNASPASIGDRFPGLRKDAPDFAEGIDAGLPAPDGTVYFFRGSRCVNYDIEGDEVLEQGTIADFWHNPDHPDPGIADGIAAAFNHPATSNGYLVTRDGKRYVECDTDPARHRVTSGAKVLRDRWPYRTFLTLLDGFSGRLWIFDADSGQTIRQGQTGRESGGVVVSPDGFRVLATTLGSGGGAGSLVLLDITAGTLKTVGAGRSPYRVAALPDGSAAYVTDVSDEAVYAIDLVTGNARRLDIGPRPEDVVASPEGDRVYVARDANPAVAVVDTAQHAVTGGFGGDNTASCMALTPDGTTLVFGIVPVNMVAVASTSGGGEPPLVPVGQSPEQLVASPDSRYVYVANRGAEVKVIDVAAIREVTPIRVRDRSNAIALSPDGEYLYVTSQGVDSVQKLRVSDGVQVGEFALGSALERYAYLAIGPAWG
ncbi:cell surface protein [Streptomyces klenkii]|uniref:cell surface protein n=1 Tax=Streptomyces klenkii TaxID=1420899 RepID=UPI0036E7B660